MPINFDLLDKLECKCVSRYYENEIYEIVFLKKMFFCVTFALQNSTVLIFYLKRL